jgi:hypothetical protein
VAIVILHVLNQDAIVGEMEKLPDPKDSFVSISNPRKMDNRPVTFIDKRARVIIFPWNQIFFIEVMESEEEKRDTLNIWRE